VNDFGLGMRLISKGLFEYHLSAHLNRMEPGLAAQVRRKVGYAWRPIIEHMYREHADDLTFANLNHVLSESANSLARLNSSIEE
jgi:hypothetical protein